MPSWTLWLVLAGCAGDGTDKPGPPTAPVSDWDGDGFEAPADCNDADASVFPGAVEVPYDGVDQDCADGDLYDVDDDGFAGTQVGGVDCDDDAADVNPDAVDDVGDGIDEDCDGVDGMDIDQDGWAGRESGGDDCDDANVTVYPGAPEVWYDGIDQDCARDCDWDADKDGAVQPGFVPGDNGVCDQDPAPGRVLAVPDCDEADPLATDQALASSTPRDGGGSVDPAATIVAVLTTADPAATLTLTDPNGAVVAGSVVVDGLTVTFTPAAPLQEATRYDAGLTHVCGTDPFSFTTRAPPGTLDPSLVGRVWEADLGGGTWVSPPGLGVLLGSYATMRWWATPAPAGPGTGDLLLAPVSGGVQEVCVPTIRMPIDQWLPGAPVVAGPADVALSLQGADWRSEDLTVTGDVAVDGSVIRDATVGYWLDTVPLVPMVSPGGTDDSVCLLLAAFGVGCAPCPDGNPYCVEVLIELGDLAEVASPPAVVERTDADILADPACP